MKFTKVIAALVFGLFLSFSAVVGVSAQDDTMTKQTETTMTQTKSTGHMGKKRHMMMMKKRHMMMMKKRHMMMMKKRHMMKKHRMMKKTMTETKSS